MVIMVVGRDWRFDRKDQRRIIQSFKPHVHTNINKVLKERDGSTCTVVNQFGYHNKYNRFQS